MKFESACTTVLVGKKATIDGSTMASRNDDTFLPITPQKFIVYPSFTNKSSTITSGKNGFTAKRPETGYGYQATPNVDVENEGVFDENGFNEANVGMSATESVYANERVLAADPLVNNGLAEDSIVAMVLPFIDSAREGVTRLAEVIAEHGSPEGNGVIFSDKDDVWYMEIVTGHHWVAQRIPDDSYAVTGNRVAIQQVDFSDSDNFMWSDGIQALVSENHLNPDLNDWNFRRIFGTYTEFDQHYNTPRQWYGHKLLSPSLEFEPEDLDLPFILPVEKKLTLEDVEQVLSSHYNGTDFDPLGHGSDADKHRYRPISLARTQNSHILQVLNDVPEAASTIMWLCFGIPSFTPFVPFFGNSTANDISYTDTPMTLDIKGNSAYWMYRTLSMLVESHHSQFIQADLDYLKDTRQFHHQFVNDVTSAAEKLDKKIITEFLTRQNKVMTDEMAKRTNALISELIMHGLELSDLTFKMDANL
ncbi:dipeptidase [Paucilactobacillus oligofermentans DSM 15707 = LMG 22743]|uniref:Dipeptidase n=1 Tax=Paucilactobacillus oligofermentans DSM 15707 = LMG 22743 TaxID=1423778 RepID=A0A0R1RFB2_9LACO|nr:C69 family dipeptidase [Paucilactobacillus oligofermentans]KRL55420.1 dipeptidase [Paucilactobacillus oligofermentans DSM 15707 = LMG 22743]CUS25590.1 Putative dipeptidase A [Paucilactobacillus oligofermentans DSM 15707 = LMG 22743]